MKIQDLQQPYRALAEMRREQNSNNYFATTFEFDWESTPEKNKWWYKVWSGGEPEIPAESLAELKEWQKGKQCFDCKGDIDKDGQCFCNKEFEAVLIAEQPEEETDWEKEYNSLSEKFESYKDLYDALLGKYETLEKVVEQIKIEKAKQKANDFVESVNEFNQSVSECFAGLGKLTESVEKERLFTAAVAAMQGLIIANESSGIIAEHAWDYAQDLINEGKKRGHL